MELIIRNFVCRRKSFRIIIFFLNLCKLLLYLVTKLSKIRVKGRLTRAITCASHFPNLGYNRLSTNTGFLTRIIR